MLTEQDLKQPRSSYGLFLLWFIVNSLLWITCHTLVGYVNLGIFGYQSTASPVGFVAGILVGLFIGFVQWIILSRSFSISPLWILSCVIGFTAYYIVNWYTGAILMGGFQQYLIRKKLNDSFLWSIVLFLSLAINGLQIFRMGDSLASLCFGFIFYAVAYGLPPSILLAWYRHRLSSQPQVIAHQSEGT